VSQRSSSPSVVLSRARSIAYRERKRELARGLAVLRRREPTRLQAAERYHPRLAGRSGNSGSCRLDPTTFQPRLATPLIMRRRSVAANYRSWRRIPVARPDQRCLTSESQASTPMQSTTASAD
jgi:hypothetical protein